MDLSEAFIRMASADLREQAQQRIGLTLLGEAAARARVWLRNSDTQTEATAVTLAEVIVLAVELSTWLEDHPGRALDCGTALQENNDKALEGLGNAKDLWEKAGVIKEWGVNSASILWGCVENAFAE